MKLRTTFQMRCLAFAMALVLVITGSGLGEALRVFAVTDDRAVLETNVAELIADKYKDLSAAEKALLNSGLLNADHIHYTVPTNDDQLVVIDEETKTVTADTYEDGYGHVWTPNYIELVVGEDVVESGMVNNGKYVYTYTGNAFSVRVEYAVSIDLDVETQQTLLNTGFWLKEGIAQAGDVAAQYGFISAVEQAMPQLVELANTNVDLELGGVVIESVGLSQEAKDAIFGLEAEMAANGGILKLTAEINEHDLVAKTYYVLTSGLVMKEEAEILADKIAAIDADLAILLSKLENYKEINLVDEETVKNVETLQKITAELAEALSTVEAQTWVAAEKGTVLVAEGITAAGYEALDELVAALGEQTVVDVNPGAFVDSTVLSANLSMFNVTVNVVLKVVEDKVDSAELVVYDTKTITFPMLKDATADEIRAAVEESGIVASALEAWDGVYVVDGYFADWSELPEALTEDTTYTITYAPVNYTITMDYADEMVVPYGYKYMLPFHEDPAQSYDYKVNGEKKAQGEIITIVGATEITRTAGKAYASYDLYSVIADNYGDALAKEILKSGALKGNETISVRKPDPTDAESLLTLVKPTLTAKDYAASYMGLSWTPYTYGENGVENFFEGNTGTWNGASVKVQYRLNLTNYTVDQVNAVLALAKTLKDEANAQKSTLDAFAANYDVMGQLDKTKLGALNGVIGVTDFTPGDGTDSDARNLELRAYFAAVVGAIISDHLDADGKLTIYNMLGQYKVDGLRYYYNNAADFIAEIEALAGYLGDMIAEEEALTIMVTAAGFPEYAEKITGLEESLATVMANLTEPNAAIDLNSSNLGKLLDALTKDGTVTVETSGNPYLLSEMLTALDDSTVIIQVIIETPNGNATVTSADLVRGQTVVTEQIVNNLKAAVNAKVNELLQGNTAFYSETVDGNLNELVGTTLDVNANIYYTYSVKNFTVLLDGQDHETININDLEINLPKHPAAGWRYEYTVDGEVTTASTYTFTTEQVLRLFVNGTYNISRVAINEGDEKLENTFGDWLIKDGNGNLVQILAAVTGDQNGIVNDFVMKIVNSGYSYIALNGEALMYMNDSNELEISLQTLINAILNDNTFGADTLINLGKNGKGKLVKATMTLGNSADDILFEDVPFELHLTTVPGVMGTVANGLSAINPYIDFYAQDGVMNVDLTLPEKVYEAYLAGLMVTGNLDKTNLDEINSEIAFQFLWDYVDIVRNTEADAETFTNTLAMLGQNYNLNGYDKYYQMVKAALNNEGLVINPEDPDNDVVNVSITGKGRTGIDALINLLGINVGSYSTYLGMIKEYKVDVEGKPLYDLSVSAVATLTNTSKNFQAAVVDVRASGIANKADFTDNLPARIAQITGEGLVMLVDNVEGNLVVNGTVILDLNGFTVDGNIVSNGTLYIVDSSLQSVDCGRVTGTVSGNVTVIGGTYDKVLDPALLKDGYKQVNGSVVNNLFSVVLDKETNTYTYEINSDVITYENGGLASHMPNVRALAVDIAVDLVLNYYTAAALTVDGDLYHINIEDIIALITTTDRIDSAIQTVLDCIDVPGIGTFANSVLDDLLSFDQLYTAFANETAFASYDVKVAPWQLTVKHVTDADYITFGIGSNEELAKEYTVALKLVGGNKDKVLNILAELADHVEIDANVDLKQPTYDAAGNDLFVNGNGELNVTLHFNYDEYRTVVAVVLANGNPDKAQAMIAALNTGLQAPLKAEVDKATVQDIFDALKALNRDDTFAGLCEKLGVTVDTAEAKRVEGLFHFFLCAAGKGLDYLNVDGPAVKLGSLDTDGDGIYVWTKTVTRAPEASAQGYTVYAEASVSVTFTLELFDDCEHVNTKTVVENKIPADCVNPGSYDEVVYCVDCGEEISRTTVVIPALGHVAGEVVIENEVAAECGVEGSYDEVVYCSVCGEEISRNTVTVPALEHVPGAPVYENVVAPDCTNPGSHDEVIYCELCGEELERKTVHDSANGHSFGEWVEVEPATCEKVGKMERVCSVCGHTETEIIPVTDHVPGEPVIENEVPADCTNNGSYDEVVYCEECGIELSRTTVTVEATGHVAGETVIENVVEPKCEVEGSHDEVVYCSICGEELSRETVVDARLEHIWSAWITVVEPDVGVEGRKERTCQICGAVDYMIIPALDAPPTGDEFPVALYVSLMVMSVIGMGVLVWFMLCMKKTGRYSSK